MTVYAITRQHEGRTLWFCRQQRENDVFPYWNPDKEGARLYQQKNSVARTLGQKSSWANYPDRNVEVVEVE